MKYATAIVVLWVVVCSGSALAQETTGAIIGTITSEDGQSLPGATLKLCDDDKGFERTAVSPVSANLSTSRPEVTPQ